MYSLLYFLLPFCYELIYEFYSFPLTLSFLFDLVIGERSPKALSEKKLNIKKVESESDKNKAKNDKEVQEKLGMTTVNKKSPQAEKSSGGKDVT